MKNSDKTISRPKLSTNWISILGKEKSNISGKRSGFFFMVLHHGTILCYLNTNTGAKRIPAEHHNVIKTRKFEINKLNRKTK